MTDDSQWARPTAPPADLPAGLPAEPSPAPAVEEAFAAEVHDPQLRHRGESLLVASGIVRRFLRGSEPVIALDGVDIELFRGEIVALVGRSGSGKTTLLNVLCGWEIPDVGTVSWHGRSSAIGKSSQNGDSVALADVEWEGLSLVPQAPGLIEDLTVAENVGLPCRLRNDSAESTLEAVAEVLEALGLTELTDRYPDEVSLGEQQRTSVARALVLRPDLLLADEPTAHQDARSMGRVLQAVRVLVDSGRSCIVASHNPEVLDAADRVVEMRDGRLS
jgi:ABC-type lipoprotein export system ATPase subunit